MKKTLLILLLQISFCIQSQTFKIQQGEEFETPRVVWENKILDADNTGFYFLRNKNGIAKTFILHKIDRNTAKTVYEKEINIWPFKAFNKNGIIMLFESEVKISIVGKTVAKIILYQYSSATGEPISEPVLVDELVAANERQSLGFNVYFSPDNKKMLLTAEVKENEKLQKVICKLYNTGKYSKLWEKEAVTTYKNSTVSSSHYMINNNGDLMYLFKYLRSMYVDKWGDQTDISFSAVISSGDNKNQRIIEIPNEGLTLNDVKLFQINNDLLCAGNYATGEKDIPLNAKKGFFFVNIDIENMNIKSQSYNLITDKLADRIYADKEKNTNISWSIPEIFYIDDSYYSVSQHEYTTSACKTCGKILYDDQIFITKYNSQTNKLDWMQLIERSSEPETVALNYIITDKLHFIYYENPVNIEKFPDLEKAIRKEYKSALPKTAVIVDVSIDNNGKLSRTVIPFEGNAILEVKEPLKLFTYESKSLIVPVNITKKLRRYDILKLN